MLELEYPLVLAFILFFIFGSRYLKPKEDALLLSGLWGDGVDTKSYLWILKWLGIVFMLFALSSPISKKEFFPHKEPAHAIMLDVDLSGSMRYPMIGGRKIEVAKHLASEFIKQRDDDHVGAVAFGDYAYVASPLTYDTRAVSEIVKRFYEGLAGSKTTTLYDSVFMAIRTIKKSKAKEKVIVLLTDGMDGRDFPGGVGSRIPLGVLERTIKNEKVKIYSIGIGNPRDYNGRVLKALADISDGKFYQATSASALKNIYKEINRLEKSDLQKESIVQKFYYFQYPLFISLLLFILFLYFKIRRGN